MDTRTLFERIGSDDDLDLDESSEVNEDIRAQTRRNIAVLIDEVAAVADILSKPNILLIMLYLKIVGPQTAAELARRTGLSESNTRRYLRNFARSGLIVYTVGLDGRKRFAKLTSMGERVVARLNDTLLNAIRECGKKENHIYDYGIDAEADYVLVIDRDCLRDRNLGMAVEHERIRKHFGILARRRYGVYEYFIPVKKKRSEWKEWEE